VINGNFYSLNSIILKIWLTTTLLRLYFQSNSKVFYKHLLTRLDIATGASCGDLGASIGLENDNDIFLWNVIFEGPADTLYEVSNRKSFTQN
jgi:hypothetical protein